MICVVASNENASVVPALHTYRFKTSAKDRNGPNTERPKLGVRIAINCDRRFQSNYFRAGPDLDKDYSYKLCATEITMWMPNSVNNK